MEQTSPAVPDAVKASARRWVARLSEDRTSEAHAQFERWLAESPSHGSAYRGALQIWHAVGELRHLAAHADVALPPRWHTRALCWLHERVEGGLLAWRGPQIVLASGAAAACVVGFALLLESTGWLADGIRHSTAVAEVREVALPDGTTVTIGARSAIETRFTARQRRVTLWEGEAAFDVAHDGDRPFVVAVDGVLVRAVGTRFDVHDGAMRVRVTVTDGAVDVVEKRALPFFMSEPQVKRVRRGEQIMSYPGGTLSEVKVAGPADLPAWQEGILRYRDASLAEVLEDVDRYHPGQILLGSEDIGALRLTTSFSIWQLDEFLAGLPEVIPVRIERPSPGKLVVMPTSPASAGRG